MFVARAKKVALGGGLNEWFETGIQHPPSQSILVNE